MAVEGLLYPGDPVGRPVHLHDRTRLGIAGEPQQLTGLPSGDDPEQIVGDHLENGRWSPWWIVGPTSRERTVPPGEDVEHALAEPGTENRPVSRGGRFAR